MDEVENGVHHGNGTLAMEDLYTVKYEINSNHKAATTSIKISPDGKTMATSSSDSTIKVYNFKTGELITELMGHTMGISEIEYSPINSDILASCSDDLTIRLWCISKQKCIKILKKHTYHVTTIKFTSKGNILISGSADETITIWDLLSGKILKTLAAHSDPILSLSITPDNSIIISASYDGLMRLFDLETGQCLKTLTYNSTSHGTATASTNDVLNFPISNVEISPNGKYILSSSLDGVIRLWDYMNNKIIKTYNGKNGNFISEKYCCGSKFIIKTQDPKIVSGSESDGLLIWDLQSKSIDYQYKVNQEPVLQLDTFDEGKIIATCTRNGIITILELNDKYLKHNLTNDEDQSPTPNPEIQS